MVLIATAYQHEQEGRLKQSTPLTSPTAEQSALRKNDLILLSAILAEQYISDGTVWDCVQKDLLSIMEHEQMTHSSLQRS